MKSKDFFKKIVIIAFVISALYLIFSFFYQQQIKKTTANNQNNYSESLNQNQIYQKPYLSINNHIIYLEIASTSEKRIKGLSERDYMPKDYGMLFIFDSLQKPQFWMYEMKFPLDFIWIKNDIVVQIDKNIPIPSDNNSIAIISPKSYINKVLEVNAGVADYANIKIGDKIYFNY
jgi:uncharacterized membrane protein (UPF0127 family)